MRTSGLAGKIPGAAVMLSLLVSAALLTWLFGVQMIAPASSEVVIAVTPTRIPLSLVPEEAQKVEVTLINQGTEEVSLRPRVMTLNEGAEGEPVLEQDSTCSWFSPDKQELHLMPSQSGPFAFSALVPGGVNPGLYRFALTFEPYQQGMEGIGLTGGLAVVVELEVLKSEAAGMGGFAGTLFVVCAVIAALLLAVLAAYLYRRKNKAGQAGESREEGT